jgi:hypothetical protein
VEPGQTDRRQGGAPPDEARKADGRNEDFLTGLIADDSSVWGRTLEAAVMKEPALYVTDHEGGSMGRVT